MPGRNGTDGQKVKTKIDKVNDSEVKKYNNFIPKIIIIFCRAKLVALGLLAVKVNQVTRYVCDVCKQKSDRPC